MSPVEKQIEAFMSGTSSGYAFPAGLSVEERKLVKSTAENLGLSSCSYGMGSERQIHIFKPGSLTTPALEPMKYSVKNTFVDGPLDATAPEQVFAGPAHQSMPVGSLQEHIAAEEESFVIKFGEVDHSPRNSEVDTSSNHTKDSDSEPLDSDSSSNTKDSDSEPLDPIMYALYIKNSFVHFETEQNADPRIVQSMPAGTFAANIQEEKAAVESAGRPKPRPLLLSEDSQNEGSSAMVFPSTPNAETQMSFGDGYGEAVPVVQWFPASASSVTVLPPAAWAPPAPASSVTVLAPAAWAPPAPAPSVTVLPPAAWAPPAPAQTFMNEPSAAAMPVSASEPSQALMQAPPQIPPQAPPLAAPLAAPPAPPHAPPQAPPQGSTQGLPEVLQEPPKGTPQTSTAPMPPPSYFVPGTPVMLQGLANQPDFNGLCGVVSAFDADCGRYNVMIEIGPNAARKLVKVKAHNIVAVPPQPPCHPPSVNHPGKASLVLDQMV